VSSTAVPTPPPARVDARTAAWSWPSRLVAAFSGTPGLVVKLVLLAAVNGIAVWAAVILAALTAIATVYLYVTMWGFTIKL